MMTLPTGLANFMQGKNLDGLKPFAFLFRNKWVEESGDAGHYELDTTPIDISSHIVKPNTLSMTLDVNEVAQYNANNVTLTLADDKNYFVEGTPNSYFPEGYQIYGSRVVLSYGIEGQDYLIENGKLLWANPNIYLQSSGTQYIDTGIAVNTLVNPKITTKFKMLAVGDFDWFGTQGILNNTIIYDFPSDTSGVTYIRWGSMWSRPLVTDNLNDFIFTDVAKELSIGGVPVTSAIPLLVDGVQKGYLSSDVNASLTASETIQVFGARNFNPSIFHYFEIFSNGNKILHLVPVPAGLKIGNFVVPYNGMFDIVTQTFFGNQGTGDFIIGKNDTNEKYQQYTPLFTGVIKDLPTYKPEQYQVELKLVSPLEMLKDIEAKDFSDKVVGETLTFIETDSDGHKVYNTSGTGVGGFDAVYADGNKLFEGVDYEVSQTNALGLPAIVTIINSAYYASTITADYYTWKTGLTVEQIVAGLVGLAGYDSGTEDIRNVVWNTDIRTQEIPANLFTLGYTKNGVSYIYSGEGSYAYGENLPPMGFMYLFGIDWNDTRIIKGTNIFPSNFSYELKIPVTPQGSWGGQTVYRIGGATKYFAFTCGVAQTINCAYVDGDPINADYFDIFTDTSGVIKMEKNGNTYTFSGFSSYMPGVQKTITADINWNIQNNVMMANCNYSYSYPVLFSQKLTDLDSGVYLENYGVALTSVHQDTTTWLEIGSTKSDDTVPTSVRYRTSNDGVSYSQWGTVDIGSILGVSSKIIQFTIELNNNSLSTDFTNTSIYYLGQELNIALVNLSGKTVLEALQDFALISGYEFGVDRQGVFFFRPRVASTTPTYILDHDQIVKVDTVKKNLSDFFTKLTLTFAQVPLEFYANTGERPTPIDKYGVINKEIDKPDIVNYDNPELAQAIGPKLLEVYSALPNIIQVTGKLNLSLELGDIVSLRRNFNLVEPNDASDYTKYFNQQTYYRACKITGMNYNFAKRQITYTLRDVSNHNNSPIEGADMWEFVYDLPIQLGAK